MAVSDPSAPSPEESPKLLVSLATYNEAQYAHVLALAALERVTAGGIPFTVVVSERLQRFPE